MTLDPRTLQHDLDLLEKIEKATLRMVVQGIYDFATDAKEIFVHERDLVADIGEDITREALDRLGTSTIPIRLFGKIDYKRARYIFNAHHSVRQALFVDSKAEKITGAGTATIQTAQTSMKIRQWRGGSAIEEGGTLPTILQLQGDSYLVTTVFVKYNYQEVPGAGNELVSITIACLPSGMLQERYNPSADDTFWRVGRDAPSLGEPFRVRISFPGLKSKAKWRVQRIQLAPALSYSWDD